MRTIIDYLISITGPIRAQQDAIDQANARRAAARRDDAGSAPADQQVLSSRYQSVE